MAVQHTIISVPEETEKAIQFLQSAIEQMQSPDTTPDSVMMDIELCLRRIAKIQSFLGPFCNIAPTFTVAVRP